MELRAGALCPHQLWLSRNKAAAWLLAAARCVPASS